MPQNEILSKQVKDFLNGDVHQGYKNYLHVSGDWTKENIVNALGNSLANDEKTKLKDNEKEFVANAFMKDFGKGAQDVSTKSQVDFKSNTALFNIIEMAGLSDYYAKSLGLPEFSTPTGNVKPNGQPETYRDVALRSTIGLQNGQAIMLVLSNALQEGKFESFEGYSERDLFLGAVASISYSAKTYEESKPYCDKLMAMQYVDNRLNDEQFRQIKSSLEAVGIDYVAYRANIGFDWERRVQGTDEEKAKIEAQERELAENRAINHVEVKDITPAVIDASSNLSLKYYALAQKQAESSLYTNAIMESIFPPEGGAKLTLENLQKNPVAANFLATLGLAPQQFLDNVQKNAEFLTKSILPQIPLGPDGKPDAKFVEITGMVTKEIERLGGWAESDPEKFASIALQATTKPEITKALEENQHLLPEELRSENLNAVGNQIYIVDNEDKVGMVSPLVYDRAGMEIPDFFIQGNSPETEGKDQMQQFAIACNSVYDQLKPEEKGMVPNDMAFHELSNQNLHVGNALTAKAFEHYAKVVKEKQQQEQAEEANRLPDLCSKREYVGFYSDLKVYQEMLKKAAVNIEKYGRFFRIPSQDKVQGQGQNGQSQGGDGQGGNNGNGQGGDGQGEQGQGGENGNGQNGNNQGQDDNNGQGGDNGGNGGAGDISKEEQMRQAQEEFLRQKIAEAEEKFNNGEDVVENHSKMELYCDALKAIRKPTEEEVKLEVIKATIDKEIDSSLGKTYGNEQLQEKQHSMLTELEKIREKLDVEIPSQITEAKGIDAKVDASKKDIETYIEGQRYINEGYSTGERGMPLIAGKEDAYEIYEKALRTEPTKEELDAKKPPLSLKELESKKTELEAKYGKAFEEEKAGFSAQIEAIDELIAFQKTLGKEQENNDEKGQGDDGKGQDQGQGGENGNGQNGNNQGQGDSNGQGGDNGGADKGAEPKPPIEALNEELDYWKANLTDPHVADKDYVNYMIEETQRKIDELNSQKDEDEEESVNPAVLNPENIDELSEGMTE